MAEPDDVSGPVVVEGDLRAFKASFLVVGGDGHPYFRGAGLGTSFGPFDVAQCVHVADHVPPHPSCSCGFHGWRDRRHAVELLTDRLVAVLEVDLWGAFHEYERGFVAAAQNVRTVTVRPWCSLCPLGQEELTDLAVALVQRPRGDGELIPACDEHAQEVDAVLALDDIAAALGVPVSWATEGDPVGAFWPLGQPTPPALLHRHLPGLDDLLPDETAHVFQDAISQDDEGCLWIDPTARLIQPLVGKDVPVRLGDDGVHEALLDGVVVRQWRQRTDAGRFLLPIRAVGQPVPPPQEPAP